MLITAAVAETQPGPHQAALEASKAFARSFGMTLRRELRDRGVSVTVLEPPPDGAAADDPGAIAGEAFEALMAGRETVAAASIPTTVTRLIPTAVKSVAALVNRSR